MSTCMERAICTTTSTKKILKVPGIPAAPKSPNRFANKDISVLDGSGKTLKRKKGHTSGWRGSIGKAAFVVRHAYAVILL